MIGHGNYFIKKYDYIKKRPWDVWIKSSHGRCNDWLCVFVLRKMPTESGYCLFEPDAWMTIRLDVLYTNAYNEMVVSLYTSLNENKRMRFMKIFFPTNCFFIRYINEDECNTSKIPTGSKPASPSVRKTAGRSSNIRQWQWNPRRDEHFWGVRYRERFKHSRSGDRPRTGGHQACHQASRRQHHRGKRHKRLYKDICDKILIFLNNRSRGSFVEFLAPI